jgi:hypothetical protein
MQRVIYVILCTSLLLPSLAGAEEPPTDQAQTPEQWLKALRGSGSYREGLADVRKYVEAAFDLGAIAGASRWEDVHEYYIGLARAKGCQKGKPYSAGPVRACHRVSGPEPKMLGEEYAEGKAKTRALAKDTAYPARVEGVIVVLYDYGYVQGLKHGLRAHNDNIRWAQTYYRSCMERANDARGEEPCAESSKAWADQLLARLKKRIEAHGLPARAKSAQ